MEAEQHTLSQALPLELLDVPATLLLFYMLTSRIAVVILFKHSSKCGPTIACVLLVVVDALQPALLHFPLLISSRPGFCFPLAFMHRCTADLLARDYPTPSQQHLTWVAPAAGFALTFLSHAYAFDACFPFLSSLSSTSAFVPCRAVVCRRLKSSELAF